MQLFLGRVFTATQISLATDYDIDIRMDVTGLLLRV